MKKLGRKAFTIVELVIVIAVVAILATVLIPTFTGIVKNANKSADMQEVASINIHLATVDKIESGEDLYDAIAEVYGENKASNFAPRSASEGYHYWYDANTKTMVLKTYEEVVNDDNSSAMIKNDNAGLSLFGASVFAQNDFATVESNSFRMFDGYYLLDKAGSAIGETLNALDTGASNLANKVTGLANLASSSNDKQVADKLLEKLETVAIVGNDTTFVYNSDKVENFYFVSGITTISNNVVICNGNTNYIAKAENVSTIIFPENITSVKEKSLIFSDEGVIIKTGYDSVDDIASVFQANATNATIEVNANRYVIDGNAIKDINGNAIGGATLEFGNPVKEFAISIPSDTDFYKSIGNNIYVAYNYADEIELVAGNFVGVNDGEVSSTEITWASNNAHVKVENGIVTLVGDVPALENCTATITATAVAGEVNQSVNVYVVRPREATFTFAGQSLDMVKDESLNEEQQVESIVIDYDGKNGNIFAFDFNPVVCYPNEPVLNGCDTAIVITQGNGDVFQIDGDAGGYTLELINPTECEGLTQRFTITIGTALTKTFEVSVNDISATPFTVKAPFDTAKFLYRVGNGSTIKLGTFFESEKPEDNFTLSITDVISDGPIGTGDNFTASLNDALGDTWTFSEATDKTSWENWANAKLKFNGTGVANIKLGAVSITIEVVDAKNVTAYSELERGKNIVLLNDIKMSSNDSFYLEKARLYGNDFTFDVSAGKSTATGYVSSNCRISLNNAILDNVRVVGNPFNGFSATASGDNNICNVYSTGDCKIINSFISYCSAPVRVNSGNIEIVNTTLLGGSIANLDIRGGNIILDNVTTINQKSVNDTPASEGSVGFGVIVWYEDSIAANITIKNELKQYNYMSEDDIKNIPLQVSGMNLSNTLKNAVFGSNSGTSAFIYTDGNGTKWVNTGVFSMTNGVGSSNIDFSQMENAGKYAGSTVSYSMLGQTKSGYLFSQKSANVELENPTTEYVSAGQGIVAPSFAFELGSNYQTKVDGNNNYCYVDENGKINVSFDYNGSKEFSLANLCTATKGGKSLTLTNIYVDGGKNPYTEGTITFDASGEHTINFEFVDKYNYSLDGTQTPITYLYTVNVLVTEADPASQHAKFTFGSSNAATETFTINDKTYLSATGVTATDKQWGYISVNGQKVFYPIIEAQFKKATFQSEYTVYYYVFNGTITITDYKDGGKGDAITYDASTTTMPSNLSVVNGMEAKYTDINSACVDISKLTKDGPSGEVWNFSNSNTVSGTTKYNGYLAHSSPSGLAIKSGTRDYNAITVAQFSYTDNAGATYYYFVGYYMPNQMESSGGSSGSDSCVTPDTLITLADGTQKRVDQLTGAEKLLVWNLEKGCYDEANIVFVDSEKECEVNVIHLIFSDGSQVKVIGEHGFFDIDLAKYVYIDENNYSDYIGHRFVKEGDISNNEWNIVTLERVNVEKEITTAWSPVTAEQLCYYTNGILSMPGGIDGLFNIFEVDVDSMSYDAEKMAEDIAEYGLFTFEDFDGMIPEEAYIVFNGDWLKVAIGKGILTWEDIARYAERYIPLM